MPPSPPPTWSLGSFGNASIDHWDASFLAAVAAVKAKKGVSVDPRFMKAMMAVESGNDGNYPASRCRSDGSCGPMQIKPQFHQWRCPDCDFKTVPGQIELATHIIGDAMKAKGLDEYGALLDTYFPTDDVINGTTQSQYADRVRTLVAQMGGTMPAPSPPPIPVDPIAVIVGGAYPPITYGFLQDEGINSYAYVVGHGGTRSTQHSGVDVPVTHGTRLFTPLPGRIVCVGANGHVVWGQGCGFFTDDMYGGVGNITILFDDMDLKMTLGHCHTAVVNVDQHVAAGQQLGTSGGSNGDHCHIDLSTLKNGSYWLLDARGPTLRDAMGGVAPVTYASPVDVPQPDDDPPYVIVRAIRTTPVLQRANPAAPPIFEPLNAGTEFHAQEKVIGADGRWWWIGRLRGRVAEADTEVVKTVLT